MNYALRHYFLHLSLSLSLYIYMYKSEIDVGSNFELLLVVEADVIMGADYEIAFSLAK